MRVPGADLGAPGLVAARRFARRVVGGDPLRVALVQEHRPDVPARRPPEGDRPGADGGGEVVALDHGRDGDGQPVAHHAQRGRFQRLGGGDLELQYAFGRPGVLRPLGRGRTVEMVQRRVLFGGGELLDGGDHVVELHDEGACRPGDPGGRRTLPDAGGATEQYEFPGPFRHPMTLSCGIRADHPDFPARPLVPTASPVRHARAVSTGW